MISFKVTHHCSCRKTHNNNYQKLLGPVQTSNFTCAEPNTYLARPKTRDKLGIGFKKNWLDIHGVFLPTLDTNDSFWIPRFISRPLVNLAQNVCFVSQRSFQYCVWVKQSNMHGSFTIFGSKFFRQYSIYRIPWLGTCIVDAVSFLRFMMSQRYKSFLLPPRMHF